MNSEPFSQREVEIQNAKAALLQAKDGEVSTYDLLAKVIRKVLDERPANSAEVLGQIIDKVKLETSTDHESLATKSEPSQSVQLAEQQKGLFEIAANGENEAADEDEETALTVLPDMQELLYFFEQGSCGLGREEWIRVYFGLKKLSEQVALQSCRFWGKILGLHKNYYIAEIQFRDEEDNEEGDEQEAEEMEEEEEEAEDDDKLPRSTFKPPPKIPTENTGTPGTNKYVYFVCNTPGEEWTRLPSCTPAQIQASRSITKFLTGDLNAPVDAFPVFPGNESNLLRAQIARISAGTIVAPMTFFHFDEDEEVDEEDMAQTDYIENPDFEGVPIRDLADPSGAAWVHTRLHILQQGRCIWWNPKEKSEADEEYDEDEDEGDGDDNNDVEQEIGPPLLTPLSDDLEVSGLPPWSMHLSSGLAHIHHTLCIIRSNLWPGAVAFSNGRRFENVYIGWGLKYQTESYSPSQPQPFCQEFNAVPEMAEVSDPTVEEETALKQANAADEGEDEEEEEEDDD